VINDPAFLPSYRTIRRGRRMDPGTRRLLTTAGGIGAVMVVVIGGWSLLGRGPNAVPVIAAPSGPMRVKPANPGGMTVIGAGQDLMDGGSGKDGVTMQSAPEQPALAALHALEAKTQTEAAAPAAAAPVAAAVQPPAAAAPLPAVAPARLAAPPARVSTPAPSAASPQPASKGTQVQLAAMDSRQAAMAAWQHLAQQMPALLGNRQPTVERAEVGGRTVWRLRTAGFATIAVATQFCQQVRARGGGCSIAAF
jgi:hypothetical protein